MSVTAVRTLPERCAQPTQSLIQTFRTHCGITPCPSLSFHPSVLKRISKRDARGVFSGPIVFADICLDLIRARFNERTGALGVLCAHGGPNRQWCLVSSESGRPPTRRPPVGKRGNMSDVGHSAHPRSSVSVVASHSRPPPTSSWHASVRRSPGRTVSQSSNNPTSPRVSTLLATRPSPAPPRSPLASRSPETASHTWQKTDVIRIL